MLFQLTRKNTTLEEHKQFPSNSTPSLLQTIACQMEIAAEITDGFVHLGGASAYRLQEYDYDHGFESLIRSGYLRHVPSITSQEIYIWMTEFAAAIRDRHLGTQLRRALEGISASWKFRAVLYHNPDASDEWERFKKDRLLGAAEDWLEYQLMSFAKSGNGDRPKP